QIQYLGLPVGLVEAGQTDFWVPRGYARLIVNARGTCGSEDTYSFGGEAEHGDLYDLIEWAAAQEWCDGNVGMIGVSYFAIVQDVAAAAQPPHLKAIFPWSGTVDVYRETMWHGGMFAGLSRAEPDSRKPGSPPSLRRTAGRYAQGIRPGVAPGLRSLGPHLRAGGGRASALRRLLAGA